MVALSDPVAWAQQGFVVTASPEEPTHTSSNGAPYEIRLVDTEKDLVALNNLEELCWKELRVPLSTLRKRIENHACWVATVDTTVIGVMYTQRIASLESFESNRTPISVKFENQEQLHDPSGAILQLLSVAVHPEYAYLQIGLAVRNFVLNTAIANPAIYKVIAMTRCSSTDSLASEEEYLRYVETQKLLSYINKKKAVDEEAIKAKAIDAEAIEVEAVAEAGAEADQTLSFHFSAGATVISAIPGYRANDRVNWGYAVLICYVLDALESKLSSIGGIGGIGGPLSTSTSSTGSSRSTSSVREVKTGISMNDLQMIVSDIIGGNGRSGQGQQMMTTASFAHTPFMNLGMY